MKNSTGNNKHLILNPNIKFATNPTLFPYPSDDLLYASFLTGNHFTGGGLLSMPPPSRSYSYPLTSSVLGHPHNLHHFGQQPPLLPLPMSPPLNDHNINITRCNSTTNYNNIRLSPPPINKKVNKNVNKSANKNVKNRVRQHSVTPKKTKNQLNDAMKEAAYMEKEKQPQPQPPQLRLEKCFRPDTKDLLKEVVISSGYSTNSCEDIVDVKVDEFTGFAVFAPSPPPSSLPLPTFFLQPKVSCKAEVSGVDDGASDSLRRLLRL